MEAAAGEIVIWDIGLWGTIVAIIALLLLSAFFSGSETALTAASRAKLNGMAKKGNKGAQKALALMDDNERLIGAVLLGNNLVNILAAALATSLFTMLYGSSGVAVTTIVMTLLVLIFAEVMPKTYAITNPESAAKSVSPIIMIVVRVLSPIVNIVRLLVRFFLRLLGVKIDPDTRILAHQEIAEAIVLHHSEGGVQKDDRDRLLGALDLKNREVEEIMLHRSNIEMIDAADDPNEILTQALQSPYTRIPVFKDEPENIVGVVHAKDLLRTVDAMVRGTKEGLESLEAFDIMDIAMEPYFVPETTSLDDQMREFLRRKSHFALVVDEYGSLQGLITLEDILEEIVGEIADEHDVDAEEVERTTDGEVIVDGSMTIRDVNRSCDWSLPDEEANTVAGLVIYEAQTIPTEGQIFSFHGYRFEVLSREHNRIAKIRIRRLG
ncbi:MAG: HlyC/CorC family transporter [Rhodobacteraceae bacterium]|nr:HlyC/CorC family transporter [Paracoccaceae bacterium]